MLLLSADFLHTFGCFNSLLLTLLLGCYLYFFCSFCCYSAVRLLLLLSSVPLLELLAYSLLHSVILISHQSLMTMPPRYLQQSSIVSCCHCSCSYFWVPRRRLLFVHYSVHLVSLLLFRMDLRIR